MRDSLSLSAAEVRKHNARIAAAMTVMVVVMLLSLFLPWSDLQARSIETLGGTLTFSGRTSTGLEFLGGTAAAVVVVLCAACLVMALCRTRWSILPGLVNAGLCLIDVLDHNSGGGPKGAYGSGRYLYIGGAAAFAVLSFNLRRKPRPVAQPAKFCVSCGGPLPADADACASCAAESVQ